ncbi:hypothetical protein [Sediminispirochaeta smaragdinae]|uniref:Uncharacterized protein n=1 Tax=Sediminispirochaeta smaragdinae (strain DSM 11293 / JCM 15392 / SEBR 4228) TaxID=573413 RepID=E1R230_SEDSS|nr:hypothetical protein [Sediminispirochaeta smaragdinae]ADK81915.1 hypothetical protein Spirs_2812 [Sediminispirochaeta smaragdinae DSM 11293]
MPNAFDAILKAMETTAMGLQTYQRIDAPRVEYEATKLQSQIKLGLDSFSRDAEKLPYGQIQQAWTERQEQITDMIGQQPSEIQYVMKNWWQNASTSYQSTMNGLVDQKYRAQELTSLSEQIDELAKDGSDESIAKIKKLVESANGSGVIDPGTAYKLSFESIAKVNYNAAKANALQIMDKDGVSAALEYAMNGNEKLSNDMRIALRNEIKTIYTDRENGRIQLDTQANDDASSLAEQILDGEKPLSSMDQLIESDTRMSGRSRLNWRNWMIAVQTQRDKEPDPEMAAYAKTALNKVMEDWEKNGPKAEQKNMLLQLLTNGYINKNTYDDYLSTISKDPITEPEFDDGIKLIKSALKDNDEGMEQALAAFRQKVYANRYIGDELNQNRWTGQELAQVAQNIAAPTVLNEMKMDQFHVGGFNLDGSFLNSVEENILNAQNGRFLGLTEEHAQMFNQIQEGQEQIILQLLPDGTTINKITRNKNGLPEFHTTVGTFMFAIPTDENGEPTSKDEVLIYHLGGDQWAEYDRKAVKQEADQRNVSDATALASAEKAYLDQEDTPRQGIPRFTVNDDYSPLEKELDLMRQELLVGGGFSQYGRQWDSTATRRIKEIAERRGLPTSTVVQAAKSVGYVDEDFKIGVFRFWPFGGRE